MKNKLKELLDKGYVISIYCHKDEPDAIHIQKIKSEYGFYECDSYYNVINKFIDDDYEELYDELLDNYDIDEYVVKTIDKTNKRAYLVAKQFNE